MKNYDDKLGIIKGPCMAAGEYHGVSLLDIIKVDGENYKEMFDYAIKVGHFSKEQLYSFYVWRFCFISKVTIIREKECNIHNTSKKRLFRLLYKFPQAWIELFPYMLIPRWVIILRKRILKTKSNDSTRREGDNVSL